MVGPKLRISGAASGDVLVEVIKVVKHLGVPALRNIPKMQVIMVELKIWLGIIGPGMGVNQRCSMERTKEEEPFKRCQQFSARGQ